jgi:Cu/Ag efflux protein CusF
MKKTLAVLAAVLALPLAARAQKPVTKMDAVELTTTIEAIDHSSRMVTLKDKDGAVETIYCGPEVKRFDELKVGDTVTFRYQESIAYAIRKPGQPSGLPTTTGEPKVVRGQGAKPSGTLSKQETATVTVKAIDPKAPSITVLTEDGRSASFRVEDPKNLKDVKVGDKVEVTYTEAFIISVK